MHACMQAWQLQLQPPSGMRHSAHSPPGLAWQHLTFSLPSPPALSCPAPLPAPAVVMQLGGSRFLDCYIPALGCDVRIHTDALLRGGAAAIEAAWRPESK